jgi:hypothetical protein
LKKIIALSLLALAPAFLLAQTTAAPAKPVQKKAKPSASRTEIKSTANQMASGIAASEAALSPEDVKLAERVETGKLPCELGAFVEIQADAKSPGYFNVSTKTARYRMFPVLSRTGAIRLEDQNSATIWLQLANKSMLMDQRGGKRLADECMSPGQTAVAEALKKNPAPSLLDAPVPAKSASAAAAPSQPAVVVQPTGLPSAPQSSAVVPMTNASAPGHAQPASAAR